MTKTPPLNGPFPLEDRPWLHRFARRAARRSRALFLDGELESVADLAAVCAWRRYDIARGFAFTTYARWEVLGAVRRAVRARRATATRREPAANLEQVPAAGTRPEVALAARRALDALDDAERTLLLRHVIGGESLDDLSRALAVPKTTLWRRLRRAKECVRHALTERAPRRGRASAS